MTWGAKVGERFHVRGVGAAGALSELGERAGIGDEQSPTSACSRAADSIYQERQEDVQPAPSKSVATGLRMAK